MTEQQQQPGQRRVLRSHEEKARVSRHRSAGPGAAIFALLLILAGVAVGATVNLMPVEATANAVRIDTLFNTMLGIAFAIFLLVEGSLVFFAFRYRRKPGETGDGRPIHGSNRLEIAWTIMPALTVLWLGVYSFQVLQRLQRPPQPENAMIVEVMARQFNWEFHYPAQDLTTSPDVHLPLGRPVVFQITAADVLHSFWVPAFRVKQDAVPNRVYELYLTPDRLGRFPVRCAELCGSGHGQMGLISQVVVEDQIEFDAWVAAEREQAQQAADPVALFNQFGCNACHTLSAAGAAAQVGPVLDGIGARAAGRVEGLSAEEYIRQSITHPDMVVVEGFQPIMPKDFEERMTDEQLKAIVTFLLAQK